MAAKKSYGAIGKPRRITLTWHIPFLPPVKRLTIVIEPHDKGGLARVVAYGFEEDPYRAVLAQVAYPISKASLTRAWNTLIDMGAFKLPDYEGEGQWVTDCSTGYVKLEGEGGTHEFSGYNLGFEDPYRKIVSTIERLAAEGLESVEDLSESLRSPG